TDAHHLYVRPEEVRDALTGRARVALSALSSDQPVQLHAQAADAVARSPKEAESELEKLLRSGYRTVVAWPRRGEGDRARYNLTRLKAGWIGEETPQDLPFSQANLRGGFVAGGLELG